MENICFFDLETKALFQDLDPNYRALDAIGRRKLTVRLGLATACVMGEGEKPAVLQFDEGSEDKLLDALDGYEKIVGHNLFEFDYRVLQPYCDDDVVQRFGPRTLDTFAALKTASDGDYIGLDDLARLNLGTGKTLHGSEVPALWRKGQKTKVREYCRRDVEMLREIYWHGKEQGFLKYTKKDRGVAVGVKSVRVPW